MHPELRQRRVHDPRHGNLELSRTTRPSTSAHEPRNEWTGPAGIHPDPVRASSRIVVCLVTRLLGWRARAGDAGPPQPISNVGGVLSRRPDGGERWRGPHGALVGRGIPKTARRATRTPGDGGLGAFQLGRTHRDQRQRRHTARLRDVASRRTSGILKGHHGELPDAAFSPTAGPSAQRPTTARHGCGTALRGRPSPP